MKKQFTALVKSCCVLTILSVLSLTSVQAQYCVTNASATSTADEYISNVQYGAFSNPSGINVAGAITDYTGLGSIGTISPGIATSISVTIGTPFDTDNVFIYIDHDGDGDFDANDLVGQLAYTIGVPTVVVPITVPGGAQPGLTRLRVRMTYGNLPGPCTSFTWGEVEDYMITIEAGDCVPVNFAYEAVEDCDNETYDVLATLNGFGSTAGMENFSAVIDLTRSDNVIVDPVTVISPLVGQTVPIIEGVPFGVIVTATINGYTILGSNDPVCELSASFQKDDNCPILNEVCATAIPLECGVNKLGSTEEALADNVCSFWGTGFGVWYSITVDETTNIQLETCNPGTNFDTDISVFTGDCDALSCFAGYNGGGYLDGVSSCSYAAGGPFSEFTANPNTTYYVLVHGYGDLVGNFELSTNCTPVLCTSPEFTATAQDVNGTPITDCLEAGTDVYFALDLSGGSGNDSYNVSYILNFQQFTVNVPANEVTVIGPFGPGNVFNFTAVGADDALCEAYATASTTVCPPANDVCADAIPLECGVNVFGNIQAAQIDDECGFFGTTFGVWYSISFEETTHVTLETCHPGTDYDSDISVYTGDCGSLTCFSGYGNNGYIDGNFSCEFAGFAAGSVGSDFTANPGVTYYVLVHGYGSSVGNFELSTTCVPVLCTSPDVAVTAVDGEGSPITECIDFTPGASFYVEVSLDGGEGNDTYSVQALANFATQTQSVAANGSATFGPYAFGTLVSVTVVGEQDAICEAFGSTTASFCPPANDLCADAFEALCGSSYSGSTVGATNDPAQAYCTTSAPDISNGGVWYEFTLSDDATVEIDLSGSNYDTKLFLYSGDCGSLSCLAGNDDFFGLQSYISSALTAGTYYIYISGFSASRGEYAMSISCVNPACSPTATATAVADGEGNPLLECVSEGGEYYVSVSLSGGSGNAAYNVSANGGTPISVNADGTGILGPIAAGTVAEITVIGQDNALCGTSTTADGSCPCVQPIVAPDFILANSFPYCEDPENQGYTVEFYSPEDLGSSSALIYTWSYGTSGPFVTVVPEGSSVAPSDIIPLADFVSVTVELSYDVCNGGGIFPLSGSFGQPLEGCAPDCEGVPGGAAQPFTPCTTSEDEPGFWDADCNCVPSPDNDICATAFPIACGETVTGSTVAANQDNVCSFWGTGFGVWYSFTSPGDGTVTLETCLEGTDFDTDLSVYTGDCGALSCYPSFGGGGWIDGSSSCSFVSWASGGTFAAEAGVTYYILVHGYSGLVGNYALSLNCDLVVPEQGSIAGTVNWNSNCGQRATTVRLFTPNTNTLLGTYDVYVEADGTFAVLDLDPGTYDVIVKVNGYLAKGAQDVVVGIGATALPLGAIVNGDVNNNNSINLSDVSLVNASFGSTTSTGNYNPLADLNCSGNVNLADASLLNAGFAQSGAVAPL